MVTQSTNHPSLKTRASQAGNHPKSHNMENIMTTKSLGLEQKFILIEANKNYGFNFYEDGSGAGGHVTIKTSNQANDVERYGFYLCVYFDAVFIKKSDDTLGIDLTDIAIDNAELWYASMRDTQRVTYNMGEKDSALIKKALNEFLQTEYANKTAVKDGADTFDHINIKHDEYQNNTYLGYATFKTEAWVDINNKISFSLKVSGTYKQVNLPAVFEDGMLVTPKNCSMTDVVINTFDIGTDKTELTEGAELTKKLESIGVTEADWNFIKKSITDNIIKNHQAAHQTH